MNKKIVIVGGTSGIGLEVVKQLADKDCQIMVIGRSSTESVHLPKEAEYFCCDVLDKQALLPEALPVLDGLVYLPGTINLKPFQSLHLDDFQHDWEVNFLGAVRVIQHFYPSLKRSPCASIVLMSSVAVRCGFPFHASIASAKGAVEGLMRALAAELAPKIRVNAVAPSLTDTPLAASLLNTSAKRESMAQKHPLHGIASAEDIAHSVCFLLSDQSCRITGQIITVDGGLADLRP